MRCLRVTPTTFFSNFFFFPLPHAHYNTIDFISLITKQVVIQYYKQLMRSYRKRNNCLRSPSKAASGLFILGVIISSGHTINISSIEEARVSVVKETELIVVSIREEMEGRRWISSPVLMHG